jgi:hypothetical protein
MVELWTPVAMPSEPGEVDLTGLLVPGVVAVAVIVPGTVEDTVTEHLPAATRQHGDSVSSKTVSRPLQNLFNTPAAE